MSAPLTRAAWSFALVSITLACIGLLLEGQSSRNAIAYADLAGCWSVVALPSPGADTETSNLNGVAAISPNDVWVVGSYTPHNSRSLTLTEHWNGAEWRVVGSPSPGAFFNNLAAVTAIAPDDVWAVGAYGMAGTDSRTLAIHWDGSHWEQTSTQNPATRSNMLAAVSGTAKDNVWAAGFYSSGASGGEMRLLLHWDGAGWRQSTSSVAPGLLTGIAALSPTDVWVAGSAPGPPLISHWDGRAWADVPSASLGSIRLTSIAAAAPGDLWAAGLGGIVHGDGSTWSPVQVPPPGSIFEFDSLAFASKDDGWAVGSYQPQRQGGLEILAGHWSGSAWSIEQVPLGLHYARLNSVSVLGNDVWGAGQQEQTGSANTNMLLLKHTAGPCPSPTPAEPRDPPVPVPGVGSRTFPETGKTVTGLFLQYWDQHGGLMQQGYPISGVIGEVSDLNGRLYTMQYFERAVFEYHPEYAGSPYAVLLSQLGTFQYRKKYPNGAPGQVPNTSAGSVLFKETGQRLGGIFLQYWQTHGGLMQQGYPISDEFTEVSDLNGKAYTVQYFERAVFELHPENKGTPYEVLLSHLGRFRWDQTYGSGQGAPVPTPTAITGPQPKEIPGGEIVAGHYTFWSGGSGSVSWIEGYDLNTGSEFRVTESPTNKLNIASDGRYVVWVQDCPPYCHRIRAYDLQSGREWEIFPPAGRQFSTLFVDNGVLYYQEFTQGRAGIYSYNISTGTEGTVLVGQAGPTGDYFMPQIESGVFLYSKANEAQTDWALHARKLDGSMGDTVIAHSATQFTGYHVSGDNVVWSAFSRAVQQRDPGAATRLHNLSTGTTTIISTLPSSKPAIDGDLAAWSTYLWPEEGAIQPPSNAFRSTIEAYSVKSGATRTLVPDRSNQLQVLGIAEGPRVVFTEINAGGSQHVYFVDASQVQ